MSERVEEFYNACHSPKDGRFCGRGKAGSWPKGATIVLQSGLRGKASGRYKYATGGPGDAGHPGRGGNKSAAPVARPGGVTGGVKRGAKPKAPAAPKINKDDGLPTPKVKLTGNRRQDTLAIMRLDRGSPERKKATQAYEKMYGGKK